MSERYIPDMEPIDILQPLEELSQKRIPMAHMFGMAAAEISYQRARIAALEAALKPFADERIHETWTDDDYMDVECVKVGEVRAARAAYYREKK